MSLLTNLTGNALSVVAALHRYGGDASGWAPLKTERDGYWGPDGGDLRVGSAFGGGVPSGLVPNATVCGEGCEYGAVQAAVEAAPEVRGAGRFVIYIKEGVYEETVRVTFNRTNVVLIGEGMGKTVITGSLNVGMVGMSTYNTATVGMYDQFLLCSYSELKNNSRDVELGGLCKLIIMYLLAIHNAHIQKIW